MPTNTLIIWLWEKQIDVEKRVWRGSVSHIQSGRFVHLQTLADLYWQIALLVDGDANQLDCTEHVPEI